MRAVAGHLVHVDPPTARSPSRTGIGVIRVNLPCTPMTCSPPSPARRGSSRPYNTGPPVSGPRRRSVRPPLGDVLGDSPRVGHHRQSRVRAGSGGERTAVHDKEVVHVVGLAPTVEHRAIRVVAHPRRAVLM